MAARSRGRALTSVHVLGGDADAVVVVEQGRVTGVGKDVVLQQCSTERVKGNTKDMLTVHCCI